MSESQRQWLFTAAALVVLLGITALRNDVLTIGASVALLVIGFIALPRQRARGPLAAIVAAGVAVVLVVLMR